MKVNGLSTASAQPERKSVAAAAVSDGSKIKRQFALGLGSQ